MRKLLIGLLAVGLVLFGALLPLVLPRHCPINRVTCERIKVGMREQEVYAILGGPPGDYRTRPDHRRLLPRFRDDNGSVTGLFWFGDQGDATVIFRFGEVSSMPYFEAVDQEPVGLAELIRWRLEKLKNRWFP